MRDTGGAVYRHPAHPIGLRCTQLPPPLCLAHIGSALVPNFHRQHILCRFAQTEYLPKAKKKEILQPTSSGGKDTSTCAALPPIRRCKPFLSTQWILWAPACRERPSNPLTAGVSFPPPKHNVRFYPTTDQTTKPEPVGTNQIQISQHSHHAPTGIVRVRRGQGEDKAGTGGTGTGAAGASAAAASARLQPAAADGLLAQLRRRRPRAAPPPRVCRPAGRRGRRRLLHQPVGVRRAAAGAGPGPAPGPTAAAAARLRPTSTPGYRTLVVLRRGTTGGVLPPPAATGRAHVPVLLGGLIRGDDAPTAAAVRRPGGLPRSLPRALPAASPSPSSSSSGPPGPVRPTTPVRRRSTARTLRCPAASSGSDSLGLRRSLRSRRVRCRQHDVQPSLFLLPSSTGAGGRDEPRPGCQLARTELLILVVAATTSRAASHKTVEPKGRQGRRGVAETDICRQRWFHVGAAGCQQEVQLLQGAGQRRHRHQASVRRFAPRQAPEEVQCRAAIGRAARAVVEKFSGWRR